MKHRGGQWEGGKGSFTLWHFLNPTQPSLAKLFDNRVKVFDGLVNKERVAEVSVRAQVRVALLYQLALQLGLWPLNCDGEEDEPVPRKG